MRGLIRFGLRQSVLMNLVFIGVVVFAAAWAVPRLPVDRYPNFAFGEATVTVRWPGAAPAELERLVAKRLEDAIRGMDDLEFVRSECISGQALVSVKFVDDSDYERLWDELRMRILAVQNQLPAVDGKPLAPVFAKVETDQWLPALQINLVPADRARPLPQRQLALLAKELQTRLERLDGVKRVELFGDRPQQATVALDPALLARHGASFDQVAARLAQAGASEPAGRLALAEGDHLLRADLRFRSLDEVLAVPVRSEGDGRMLRVGDLADPAATRIEAMSGTVVVSVDGLDTVACKVAKDARADARVVKSAVEAEVGLFLAAHPGVPVRAVTSLDSTVAIDDSVGVLQWNLLQGAALVVGILGAALGLRAAAITLSGMALSFLGCLAWFWATGASVNELSLLGFVIVVGILVDDAVVVLDNITRLREEGVPLERALVEGPAEVAWPVISSVATTVAAFLPLLLMSGVVGEFFALIPIAVAVALTISVAEALLMLPLHVRDTDRLLGPPRLHARSGDDLGYLLVRGPLGWMARTYDWLLVRCLRRPLLALAGTGLLILLAVGVLVESALAPRLGLPPLVRLEFFPSDPAVALVLVEAPEGTALERTDAIARAISTDLAALGEGEVATATALAGLRVDSTYRPEWGSRYAMIQVELAGRAKRTHADPAAWIRAQDARLRAAWAPQGVSLRMEAQQGGPPTGRPINVRVSGLDDQQVRRAAAGLLSWMRAEARAGGALPGAIELAADLDRDEPVLRLLPDRERCARLGVGEAEAVRLAAAVAEGAWGGDLRRSDDDIPVRVKLAGNDPEVLAGAPLRALPDGSFVHWRDLGGSERLREPVALVRRDFLRTVTITGGLAADAPVNAFSALAAIDGHWRTMAVQHPGVSIAFGGEAESTGRSYASLAMAFLVSLFAIYAILAMQFNSYSQPLLIMSTILFAFTGVALSMGAFGAVATLLGPAVLRPERALFTVNTFIAIVALTGMVVNNAIVLIDFINQRRAGGELREVLRRCGHLRMRAILLTTLTTCAGMLPTAIGIPEFNLTWSPMAMAFVTGMGLSTALCLVVVPVLYEVLEGLRTGGRRRLKRLFPGRRAQPSDPHADP